jgi:UDP-glucuronate decarboxylase
MSLGPSISETRMSSRLGNLRNRLLRLLDHHQKIVYRPLPEDDPKQRCPDISLAKKLLAWEPVQLQDGLMKTIEYFDQLLRSDPKDERLPTRSAKREG